MLYQINNWTQLAGDGIQWGEGVNTGSTRGDTLLHSGETRFVALHFGED
jgi:hypothetical protein